MKDNDDAAQAKLAAIKSYVATGKVPEAALLKMAKLGAVIDTWMKQTNVTVTAVQCWTSLRRVLRRRALHHHEHDEQRPDPLGLRSGRTRRAGHVHDATGLGHALRAARLEQQLRRRPQQVRLLPLLQPAQALLRRGSDHGLPGDHCRHGGHGRTPSAPAWAASRPAP